ncbi:MAG: SsrA-binding protein SmpB [Candidatus Doudnabacteria bacterium]|nr:SsrA-binding protein SmpB [Candidatus Doudnabacteria bacterium]
MTFATNNRAKYDYDIKQTFDAGLVLEGREAKAVKQSNVSLTGSYVTVHANGAHLINCHIGPYKYAPNSDYDPTHSRKLLLKKQEINSLLGKEKGLVIIPLEIYNGRRGLIKLKIGLGKARKKIDKREYIKKRDTEREIRSSLS